MSGRYKKSTIKTIFKNYTKTLKQAADSANKNFGHLHFKNADARDEMEEHIIEIIRLSQSLTNEMEGYNFL